MDVRFHPAAREELAALPVDHAVEKLRNDGPALRFPHASNVRGADSLFELRPRAGRSLWRVFYRRVGETMIVAAIGPEARVDPRGFARTVHAAERRLADIEGV